MRSRIYKPLCSARQNFGHPLSRGLFFHMIFNEGAGTICKNLAPIPRYVGKINGNAPYVAGKFGKTLSYTIASSQFVEMLAMTSDTLFTGASNVTFSVSFWIKTTNASTNGIIIAKGQKIGDANQSGWAVNTAAAGTVNFVYKDATGTNKLTRTTSTSTLNDGNWHHVVGIYTSNTTNSTGQDIQIYVDGKLDQGTLTNTAHVDTNAFTLRIGGRQGTTPLYYDGLIDDVRIYSRALSAEEVRLLFTRPFADIFVGSRFSLNDGLGSSSSSSCSSSSCSSRSSSSSSCSSSSSNLINLSSSSSSSRSSSSSYSSSSCRSSSSSSSSCSSRSSSSSSSSCSSKSSSSSSSCSSRSSSSSSSCSSSSCSSKSSSSSSSCSSSSSSCRSSSSSCSSRSSSSSCSSCSSSSSLSSSSSSSCSSKSSSCSSSSSQSFTLSSSSSSSCRSSSSSYGWTDRAEQTGGWIDRPEATVTI